MASSRHIDDRVILSRALDSKNHCSSQVLTLTHSNLAESDGGQGFPFRRNTNWIEMESQY